VLTQTSNNEGASYCGQFFASNLTGSSWALRFDLGGVASVQGLRLYGGTLASNPSGRLLGNDGDPPASTLVTNAGWTILIDQAQISEDGTVVLNLNDHDLSQFNVMALEIIGSTEVGSTFDNFDLIRQTAPIARDDHFAIAPGEILSGNLLANDSTSATNTTLSVTSFDASISNVGRSIVTGEGAQLTVFANGDFVYDLTRVYHELGPEDTFIYTIGDGVFNATARFKITIRKVQPVASFSTSKSVVFEGGEVSFTNTSTARAAMAWDFDNDGQTDSTEDQPTHVYATPGIYTVSLTATNSVGSDTVTKTDLIRVLGYGMVNADFASTAIENGLGSYESLDLGWYAQNGDDGSVSPDWSAGLTSGTPGQLTQLASSGTGTRMGQFFTSNFSGDRWALSHSRQPLA